MNCHLPLANLKLRGATARWNDDNRRAARSRGLKCEPPVQLAVGTAGELGLATEMEIGLARITNGPTAIVGLERSNGLILLGHDGNHAPIGTRPDRDPGLDWTWSIW